ELELAIESKHRIPKELSTHDLFALAKIARAEATAYAYREDLLRRMSRSATWYGRYPVPLSYAQLRPEVFSDGSELFLTHLTGADVDEVRCLLRDLRDEYEATA